jgi:hypothetical protein
MLLHHKKFICKDSKGGRRTKPTLKNPKDYGINTDPPHKAFIYSVSFWFFYPPCREKHINYFIMQNHPRISAGSQSGSCHFSQQVHPSALAAFTFCLSALYPQVIVSPSASFWHQGLSASMWLFRLVLSIRCS